MACRHWPQVLARASGDQGAAAHLSGWLDVEMINCDDLASGRYIDWTQNKSA
ncbi:hypothetical protein [Mycobacterium uberis]|uniref:hypothetical protein n=1 Tax=Mycobacterium uberis TaxID=2162698 RepID=UPI0014031A24|nr:hypothetical protein [Mycobacterium uberis]